MIIDVEMNEMELDELLEYYVDTPYSTKKPEIIEQDKCFVKVEATPKLIAIFKRDNIAYWDDGELL